MLGKRINEVNAADVLNFVAQHPQESDQLEFKESLPAKSGPDRWVIDQSSVGDKARNKILGEIVAFANAYGGVLILGFSETTEKPSRALSVTPLPACGELAARFRDMATSCIEPPISQLEIEGVPTAVDGSGVVIFRTSKSRNAPHRLKPTLECFIRRGDKCEEMTMREIQDLTINVERGLLALEKRFEDERGRFYQDYKHLFHNEVYVPACTTLVTLIPLSPSYIDDLHAHEALRPSLRSVVAYVNDVYFDLRVGVGGGYRTPILRGTRYATTASNHQLISEGYNDGVFIFKSAIKGGGRFSKLIIEPSEHLCMIANALCAVARYRKQVELPNLEYGLELSFRTHYEVYSDNWYENGGDAEGKIIPAFGVRTHLFPRYGVQGNDTFNRLISVIARDYWNNLGLDRKPNINIDFAKLIDE